MRRLADLLSSPSGIEFLERNGIFTDRELFAERLRPPVRSDLADLLGVARDRRLVYVGQQLCADLAGSTATKFTSARELQRDPAIMPVVLWHDMDSTGSERYGARVVLPHRKRPCGVWLADKELGRIEPRFVAVEPERLGTLAERVEAWIDCADLTDRERARARVEQLREALLNDDVRTLADATRALASVLVRECLGLDAPSLCASEMVDAGLLVEQVEEYLANLDAVVRVFNEAIAQLHALDVDPRVHPLTDDYLPLRYSCAHCGVRLALSRDQRGCDLFAVADCRCGHSYEFHLGSGRPSLAELAATRRWSIDVSMPVHHNDVASGWVGGVSTTLYALVFNVVLERVLGHRPIPVLVPSELACPAPDPQPTVLVQWLAA